MTCTSTVLPLRGHCICTESSSLSPATESLSCCQRQPRSTVSSVTRSQRLLLRPVVMRKPRSRAARHRRLAQYQLSSTTCLTVPSTGSKPRMSASIWSILLWKTLSSASQTASCRYSCGAKRTTSREQHVEAQHQAMTDDALVLGGRVVFAQSFHLAAFWLGYRRVISNSIPGHQGLLGTTSPLGPLVLLTVSLGFDHELHLLAEVPQPACYQLLLRPRGLRQKPTQPGQTRMLTHLSQQSRQRSSSLTPHPPKPHGHEVLLLGLGELVAEPLGKVAQLVIQAYNRDWHRTPPWFQASFFFLIPHGVLSCYPLFKSANIESIDYQRAFFENTRA